MNKRGEAVGVTVNDKGVRFWRGEPANVHSQVSLEAFAWEHVGVDQAQFLVGEQKTVEVFDYVNWLLHQNRDYVD